MKLESYTVIVCLNHLVSAFEPDTEHRMLNDYELGTLQINPAWPRIKRFSYWYRDHGYEGSGDAIVETNEGTWHYFDLNHCSCEGPTDSIYLDTPGHASLQALVDSEGPWHNGNEFAALVEYLKQNPR